MAIHSPPFCEMRQNKIFGMAKDTQENMKFGIELAEIPVEIELRYPDALPTFSSYRTGRHPLVSVSVSPEEVISARGRYEPGSSDPYIEYMELSAKISDALLPLNRVLFHGAAFQWCGKAWILTAPSGTGKTTQYLLWKECFGEDVQIINGDKPVLCLADGQPIVFPSPWNGKESMGQKISAPLGGIILLRKSRENRIRRLTAQEAAGPLFIQFLFSRRTKQDVSAVARLEESMLRQIPVWLLDNRGDPASARLCHDTLAEVNK